MIFTFNRANIITSVRDKGKRGVLGLCLVLCGAALLLSGCNQAPGDTTQPSAEEGKLRVVATTTILADVVNQISGDSIQLDTLLPVGVDPHSFQPSPQDLSRLAQADVIFVNGARLEEFILPLIENANPNAPLVEVSEGITFLAPPASESDDEHLEVDPHVWTDPNLVSVWTQNIERALSDIDPENATIYQDNAEKYRQELTNLDGWIQEQIALISPEQRRLVTDHEVLSYFAEHYGFEQTGTILPGVSTVTEPTAQELAALIDAIRAQGVKAVFVGTTVNPTLAMQVVSDTGTRLISIYTGSLSEADGPASTYLDYMRYNVNAIVEALK